MDLLYGYCKKHDTQWHIITNGEECPFCKIESPRNLPKAEASHAVLDDSLPDYNEIDQVANDEANGIDWNELRYAGIYTDGFIAGALWMKRKINEAKK